MFVELSVSSTACVTSLIILSSVITQSLAQCWWLGVSGSEFNPWTGVNGQYEYLQGVTINGALVWKQQYTSMPTNYIFYAYLNSTKSGWAICPMVQTGSNTASCSHGSIPYVIEDDGVSYRPFPYDVPIGDWAELNVTNPPNSQYFVKNPAFNVTCSSYSSGNSELTAGEVCGIVIGVTLGTALLIAILLCICKKIEEKKRRCNAANVENNATSGVPAAAGATAASSAVGYRRNQPAPYVIFSPPPYFPTAPTTDIAAYPVATGPDYINAAFTGQAPAPPTYDDSLPPVYDTIAK